LVVESALRGKYTSYRDEEGPIIYDVDEELAIKKKLMEQGLDPEGVVEEKRRERQELDHLSYESKGQFQISVQI